MTDNFQKNKVPTSINDEKGDCRIKTKDCKDYDRFKIDKEKFFTSGFPVLETSTTKVNDRSVKEFNPDIVKLMLWTAGTLRLNQEYGDKIENGTLPEDQTY